MRIENGKIALASLEYFLTDRCNLRCEHCAASSPYMRDANLPVVAEFERELHCLRRVMTSDQLKLVGGEPLLNRSICEFLRVAVDSDVFKRIRVTTNGLLLSRMSDEFWERTDVVEISRYPGIERPDARELDVLRATAAAHATELEVNAVERFMLPITETPSPDSSRTEQIFATCAEANEWSCHLLHRGRLYRCSRVHSLDRYLTLRGIAHVPFTAVDGLDVDERASLFDEIRAYLTSTEPLHACSYCLGTSGCWVENRQLDLDGVRARMSGPRDDFDEDALAATGEARARGLIATWAASRNVKHRMR